MLTLHVYGPYFGLPDASPFCIKGLTLLKMSGLPYTVERMSPFKAPKGKAPYLADNGTLIADSHFLMRHLETAHSADFSGGYGAAELAKGWAVARMLEEHFYFLMVGFRWLDSDENFWKGPYQFFADAPAPVRPLIALAVRRKLRKTTQLQGVGRHSSKERIALAKGDVDAVEAILGDNAYLLGERPSAADATVLGALWTASTPFFMSTAGDDIRARPRLMAYLRRMQGNYFPDFPVEG
jgi:glutathione S-transferase